LYLIKQFICSNFDFITSYTLSCEYVATLPFLKLTVIIAFLPISDFLITNLLLFIFILYLFICYIYTICYTSYLHCKSITIVLLLNWCSMYCAECVTVSFRLHIYYRMCIVFSLYEMIWHNDRQCDNVTWHNDMTTWHDNMWKSMTKWQTKCVYIVLL